MTHADLSGLCSRREGTAAKTSNIWSHLVTSGAPIMSGHGATNAAKREEIALLLASGQNVTRAAGRAGVSKQTVHRWLAKDPTFAARVVELRAEMFKLSAGLLSRNTRRAALQLARLIKSEDERVALAASRSVLTLTRTTLEAVEFEERLAAVERRLRAKGAKL
jgi:hypothetical protein